jgi:integrase
MDNSATLVPSPPTEIRTVRRPNAELRTREHLTADEVERLIATARANRYGARDALAILLAYRHGLRASEVADLRWEQIDFRSATLHVRRVKNGTPASHPLTGRELRALRAHQRASPGSPFVFVSERGAPLTAAGFSRMVERASRSLRLRPTPTCCGMLVATPSPMPGSIRGRFRRTSDIGISRTPFGIRRWRGEVQGVLAGLVGDGVAFMQ